MRHYISEEISGTLAVIIMFDLKGKRSKEFPLFLKKTTDNKLINAKPTEMINLL